MPPRMIPFELLQALGVEAVVDYRPSRELWELLDRCQRPDLPPGAYAAPPEPEPIQIIPPPSPEEVEAEVDAQAAFARTAGKIREVRRERAVPRANCGHGRPNLIRRQDHRGVHDAMIRFKCGRSDCPYCWRLRRLKTIRRATKRLLRVDGRPRMGKLWCCEISWDAWESLNRSLRRRYGKQCGRLHLRTSGDRALVICEQPLPGGEELTPGQAVDRVLAIIDDMHEARSAFRLLGRWSDRQTSGWKLVKRYEQSFDLRLVRDALAQLRKAARWGWERHPQVEQGLLWQNDTVEDADDFIHRLEAALSLYSHGAHAPHGRKSDTRRGRADIPPRDTWVAPGLTPEETRSPFDTEQDWGFF